MSLRTSTRLPWCLFALCVAGSVSQVVIAAVADGDTFLTVVVLTSFLISPAVGALVASRQPGNAVGWLLLAGGVVFNLAGVTDDYLRHAAETQGHWTTGTAGLVVLNLGFFFGMFYILGVLVPLLFPDGRPPSVRWRLLIYLGACGLVLFTLGVALLPDELNEYGVESGNPLALEAVEPVAGAFPPLGLLSLGLAAIGAWISLVLRLRRSRGEERQQIKWFAYAAGVAALALAITFVAWANGSDSVFWDVLLSVTLVAVLPAAIGVAILRHRLYDIDLLINRTLVYGGLTMATVGSYLLLVLGFGWIARNLVGQGSNELAVASTTLIVAALFQPARRRIQSLVDRRFYRAHYDAQRTLEAFQARLRSQTDLETLRQDLARTANETMRPAHLSVWLRGTGERR